MIPSPPQEAAQFRGKTLTPVSPKPVHFPSPSNIPILEKQMDPSFNEGASVAQAAQAPYQPASYQQYFPSANPSVNDQVYGVQEAISSGAAAGGGSDAFANSAKAYGYEGTNIQDTTSIQHTVPSQFSATAASSDLAQDRNSASYDTTAQYSSGAFAQGAPHPGSQAAASEPNLSDGNGGVDFQTLLDQLSATTSAVAGREGVASAAQSSQQSGGNPTSPSNLPSHPNLPPRPPPQEKPATHPNYAPDDDIRSYHPHSQKNSSASFHTQAGLPPLVTAGASGTGANHPPPISAAQSTNTPAAPGFRGSQNPEPRPAAERAAGDDDAPWPPEIQRLFDQFLQDERANVTEGQWDKFPPGSRLFIGNLPTEKVTKRDLFHIFHKYGRLAQISLKQAYGFVQFLDAESCSRALRAEQGSAVRGRKMHLEISKPQRSNRDGNKEGRGSRRRSRSPDYTRGGTGAVPRNVDRYTSGQGSGSGRDREYRRSRDDYRPVRSPSPRGRGGRDRYSRERSRSPYERYRDPSPRRESDDDLPLPRRAAHLVPDVQFIILDAVDSQFVQYVENIFQRRGLRTNALHMSPRLSEAAVIRRQIVEGVQAVVKLTYNSQNTVKIPLQVFDRSNGADNVRFEEYQDLGPEVAAELALRAKQTHHAPSTAAYAAPQYGVPTVATAAQAPAYAMSPPQPAATANPALASMIGNLDSAGLQHLLTSLQQSSNASSQPHQQAAPAPGLTPDLSRLLGSLNQQANYAQTPAPNSVQNNAYGSTSYPAALSSLFATATSTQTSPGQVPPAAGPSAAPGQGQSQPDMQDILAQLAAYKR